MKKLKYLLAALLLVACLVGSASAITPTYKPPKLPALPQISVTVPTIKFPDGLSSMILLILSGIVGNVKIPADKLPKLK